MLAAGAELETTIWRTGRRARRGGVWMTATACVRMPAPRCHTSASLQWPRWWRGSSRWPWRAGGDDVDDGQAS